MSCSSVLKLRGRILAADDDQYSGAFYETFSDDTG